MADDIDGVANLDSGTIAKARKRGRPRGPVAPGSAVGNGAGGSESGTGGIEGGETDDGVRAGEEDGTGAETSSVAEAFNSETIVDGTPVKKKRGRPAGTKNTGTAQKADADLKPGTVRELATEIAGGYWMIAQITQQPVFDIGVDRAMMIARPLTDVQRYYPIKTQGPAISLAKLAAGILAINLPIMLYLSAQANAKRQQAKAQRATVAATPEEIIIPGATQQKYDFSGNA
jgi:hypothetical protein